MAKPPVPPDLVAQFTDWQQGRTGAKNRLLDAVRPWLRDLAEYHFGRNRPLRRRVLPSDIAQEALMTIDAALSKPGKWDTVSMFIGYARLAVLSRGTDQAREQGRAMRDYRRHRSNPPAASGSDRLSNLAQPDPRPDPATADRNHAIHKCMQSLANPKDRNILHMYYFEGRTAPEIAKQLGVKEDTAFKRLASARKKLGQKLREAGVVEVEENQIQDS